MSDDILEDDEDGVNVLIDFSQRVNVVRMMGNVVTPARLTIKAEVLPESKAREIDFDIAFAKIKFWFETIVSKTVIFGRDNTNALTMFTDEDGRSRVINQLMITPHQPTDEHLGALFQAKMTAISNGTMTFGVVRVNSDSPSGLVWTYVGDWEDDLPDMEHWFSTKPYYFDSPWWTRDDVSTIDMITQGVTDFSKPPPWAMKMDFIEQAIRPYGTAAATDEEPENIVIRGAFNPKVIDTGTETDE